MGAMNFEKLQKIVDGRNSLFIKDEFLCQRHRNTNIWESSGNTKLLAIYFF